MKLYKMKNILGKMCVLCGIVCSLNVQTATATPLDNLRDLFQGQRYTILYEESMEISNGYEYSPELKEQMRQAQQIRNRIRQSSVKNGKLQVDSDPMKKPRKYLITSDGTKKFRQDFLSGMGGLEEQWCYLLDNNQVLMYMYSNREKGKASRLKTINTLSDEEKPMFFYGGDAMQGAVRALFPELSKNASKRYNLDNVSIPGISREELYAQLEANERYRLVDSGITQEGLQYYDMESEASNEVHLDAIRFYFDDNTLVKIYHVVKSQSYMHKQTIQIHEISSTPNASYLVLPRELGKGKK